MVLRNLRPHLLAPYVSLGCLLRRPLIKKRPTTALRAPSTPIIDEQRGRDLDEASRQPKDKNYNLITVLYQSSDNVESLKTYIQDAQSEGDQELVDFFSSVLENNLEAAQKAKEMLVPRF
jgi:hypothetical protein